MVFYKYLSILAMTWSILRIIGARVQFIYEIIIAGIRLCKKCDGFYMRCLNYNSKYDYTIIL